jgi:serine/threonine protein kinase
VPIAPGTRLGQYEVQDFIGQGAMGLVFRAYHSQLERTGAVKVLQAIAPDPDTTARFRHEAQAIAQMRHPNILNVYDFGEYQGTPYMIVEFVPGGSLANRLAQGMLDRTAALAYLRGIAAGLDYAHSRGVVHRDIKPANVLLEPDDTPVIADFGLAKLLQGSSLKSMTGVTTGTPAYMAPEQVTGSKVGPAADRYSLATIAYEMLTGLIPFDGEALLELLYAQVHREPPLPSARIKTLGPRVDAVIMRGLAKDPNARWESCTAFVKALEEALAPKAAPVVARTVVMSPPVASTMPLAAAVAEAPASPIDSVDLSEPLTLAYPSPPPPEPNKKSRKGLFTLIAGVLVVILALVGLFLYAYLNQPVTLTVSPSPVVAGDSIVVTANHVPANQVGEVQLWSQLRITRFRAGSDGTVQVTISIPLEIGIGYHLVKICWSGTCHAQATLQVLSPVALATTPVANGTPEPSGSPTSSPTTTPNSTPTSPTSPTSTPRYTSTPSPTRIPTPSPSPTHSAVTTASPSSVIAGVTSVTVSGAYFSPYQGVSIAVFDPATSPTAIQTSSTVANSSGAFQQSIVVKLTALPGTGRIEACDTNSRCASTTISIT